MTVCPAPITAYLVSRHVVLSRAHCVIPTPITSFPHPSGHSRTPSRHSRVGGNLPSCVRRILMRTHGPRHIDRIHLSPILDIQEHTTYHMDDMQSQTYPSSEMRNANCFSVFLLQELIYVYFRAVSCEFVQKRNRG